MIIYHLFGDKTGQKMREWYSGSTSPCQGEDRGFDPRLALEKRKGQQKLSFSFFDHETTDLTRLAGENHLRAALRSQMILGVHHAEFA